MATPRVAVAAAQPELPDISGTPADVPPPEGGSFVRVDLTSSTDQVPFVGIRRPLATQVEVSVRADGVDHQLSNHPGGFRLDPETAWSNATGTRWVAVDGTLTDVDLVVTVEGWEQVVGSDGPVDLELEDYSRDTACTVTRVLRVPNVDGLGWAPRGREYVAVLLTLDRTVHVEGTEDESWSSATTLSARLGGEEPLTGPVDVNDLNSGTLAIQDPDDPQMFVFEVDEGTSPDLHRSDRERT